MRQSRKETLSVTGIFHKMWRGHNREHIFAEHREKNAYLSALGKKRSKQIAERVGWHSYCLMSNHTHETGSVAKDEDTGDFKEGVGSLSSWMRCAHGSFGIGYNIRHDRQGKVAYDRPKTCEIEDEDKLLEVMFYGDANPVRARLVSHPKKWAYSSYNFYAYGRRNAHTEHLTPPPAYLALGKNAGERQRAYRKLCDAYLRRQDLIADNPEADMEALFIGNRAWKELRRQQLRDENRNRAGPSP